MESKAQEIDLVHELAEFIHFEIQGRSRQTPYSAAEKRLALNQVIGLTNFFKERGRRILSNQELLSLCDAVSDKG